MSSEGKKNVSVFDLAAIASRRIFSSQNHFFDKKSLPHNSRVLQVHAIFSVKNFEMYLCC